MKMKVCKNLLKYMSDYGKEFNEKFSKYCAFKEIKSFIIEDAVVTIKLNNSKIVFEHIQDCCEDVSIIDYELPTSSPEELVGAYILDVELFINAEYPKHSEKEYANYEYYDSSTYSFLKITTSKGICDFWWIGTSNGYYSGIPSMEIISYLN